MFYIKYILHGKTGFVKRSKILAGCIKDWVETPWCKINIKTIHQSEAREQSLVKDLKSPVEVMTRKWTGKSI